jgi:hypothetical protein
MKVLIGGPVRQDKDIFIEYVKSLRALELPENCKADRYFIFNDCDLSDCLEPGEGFEFINTGDAFACTEQTHDWSYINYDKMHILRNRMLELTLTGGYDYYFLVDSDLVLRPQTLRHLLAQEKDLIAELFWTPLEPGGGWCWQNAWEYDQATASNEAIAQWRQPGVYPVGGTGACFLINRRVIEAGVSYTPIRNIRCFYGENRWFCIRAIVAGFDIFIDTQCEPLHLYRRSTYEQYKTGELRLD